MTQVVIQMEDKLASELNDYSTSEHIPRDKFVSDAVRQMLVSAFLKRSQERLGPLARAAGYNSEDDILNAIS